MRHTVDQLKAWLAQKPNRIKVTVYPQGGTNEG